MVEWNRYGGIFYNNDEAYRNFKNKTGSDTIRQFGLIPFGDPAQESFLKQIEIFQHPYKVGDTLSKISFEYYGEPRYWWILAWFNSKPTDLHCKIGDTIFVPKPLEVAKAQAYNFVEL